MENNDKQFKRYTVTTALPYANGPVHIGHLAGVYIPADTYVRYLRMKGEEVLFVGGSDEHGVPITIKAEKEGCTPQDIVDRYHNIIKSEVSSTIDIIYLLILSMPSPIARMEAKSSLSSIISLLTIFFR